MSRFIQYDRNQQYLLPPSVDEWLPEGHLARFIVEVIDQLDLSKLTRRYSGSGSAAYHPAMMLALLVYGYASGTFSSRKIERATYDSVAFRFIATNHHPDHDTLAHFRKIFLVELEDLFVQVLSLAQAMRLVKLGQISLDGTKIKANASKHKALSHGHIEQTNDKQQVEPMLSELKALQDKLGKPETLLADNGYFSNNNIQACVKQKITPLIALGREAHHLPLEQRLTPDAPEPESTDPLVKMAWKLQTQSGRALYGKRKSTVEPVFGIIKQILGFRQFSLRGLDAVTGEWTLVTMAFNMKRMHVLAAG